MAIATRGLTKRFGAQTAVSDLDLRVPRGAVFGFLGPNGSGKTTTIRMLLGLIRPSAGDARVLGTAVPAGLDRVLPRVGALVEGPAFAPFLTGAQNLARLDAADRRSDPATRGDRVATALERVGLAHAARKKAHAYSLGMKQRLGLAGALLAPRELLVLDEPTNGLDPQGTREVRALVRALAAEGATVFVSSHLLAEVEQLCSHVGVMSGGRLVAQGTLDDFRRTGAQPRVHVHTPDTALARSALASLAMSPDAEAAASDRDVVVAALPKDRAPEEIVAALVSAGVRVRGFEVVGSSLEQRFVELTGEGFDVVA
ncbi:ABC transporter ATP-binding protein [Microbacterium aurantiacum]|uniref:ABC transporter ATP-binding protein n=1 Tax=Microbacterium aurantiacum TaxID=162393 RepID=UPI001F312158|nr:ABC transporter ATP-binding protein [Microbacterium aurantiacum]